MNYQYDSTSSLTHRVLVMAYGDVTPGQRWPDGTKLLPEKVLTYRQ